MVKWQAGLAVRYGFEERDRLLAVRGLTIVPAEVSRVARASQSEPVSGEVIARNPSLNGDPDEIHRDSYGRGWLYKIRSHRIAEQLNGLLDGGIDGLVHLSDISWNVEGEEAEEGTIRKDYATDIEKNVVHGSDAPETAAFEIGYFFNAFEINAR